MNRQPDTAQAWFRTYSPFDAMLVQIQMPGARFVALAYRWLQDYGRYVAARARPLVILQPMGPVMFVFDVRDPEAGPDAVPLLDSVYRPFEVRSGAIGHEHNQTVINSRRDGVSVAEQDAGSQSAGIIRGVAVGRYLDVEVRRRPEPELLRVPLRYELLLNRKHTTEVKYATLVHELAHLYCGHLGTPEPRWWPDRRGLSKDIEEFEAESVSYLVCERLGIVSPSAEYLAGYGTTTKRPPSAWTA